MWWLLAIFLAVDDIPAETILIKTEFPLTTLEECTDKAEKRMLYIMENYPSVAPYVYYICKKESI